MKHETKSALRDRQSRIDAHVSKLGQSNAQQYLNSRHVVIDWHSLGQALMGATATLLFIYFALT
jgi:hypothetical protein